MATTGDGLDVATLRRLHELTARISGCPTLAETLQAVVDGVVEVVGFDAAVLNRRMPNGEFEVVAAAGSPEMCAHLLGIRYPSDTWDADLAVAERWGTLRFIPADRVPERTVGIMWVPDIEPTDDPDAWQANDLLYAPLSAPSGDLVGMLSVDLPRGGTPPGRRTTGPAADVRRPGRDGRRQRAADRAAADERGGVPARVRERGHGDGAGQRVRRRRQPVLPGQPGAVPDPRPDRGAGGRGRSSRRHARGRPGGGAQRPGGARRRIPGRAATRGSLASTARTRGLGGHHVVGRSPRRRHCGARGLPGGRRDPTTGGTGRAAPAGPPRTRSPGCPTGTPCTSGWRGRWRRRGRPVVRVRCCSATSTASSRSTTSTGTPPATGYWR